MENKLRSATVPARTGRRIWMRGVRFALAAAVLVAILSAWAGCARPAAASAPATGDTKGSAPAAHQNPQPRKPGAPKDQPTVFPVSVTEATKGDLSDYITVTGGIEAANQVDVYADTSGQLTKLNVRLGDYVRQNQVVAEVDPSRPGQNFVPNPVRAPISGTITSVPVDIGSRITQGVPVVQISTIGDLRIHTQIAERYIGQVRLGESAIIALDPYPDERFAGRVVELSPVVNPQTRTLAVTLALVHPDARVKAGMFAEIKIITRHKTGIVKIPDEAIVERDNSLIIFVAGEGNKAVRRKVTVGIRIDGKAEILDGVSAGEKVVVRGQTLLEDGVSINVVDQVPPLPAQDTVQ